MASCAGCISGCCLMLARVVLFLSCFVFLIAGIQYFFWRDEPEVQSDDIFSVRPFLPVWLNSVFLLSAVLGLYGSCTRDPRSLKLFTIAFTAFALFSGYNAYKANAVMSQELGSFNQTLSAAFPNYKWSSMGTEQWDRVQREFHCCGLLGPSEWLNHANKPRVLAADTVPRSCCPPPFDECPLDSAYFKGCLSRFETALSLRSQLSVLMVFIIILNIFLALIVTERRSRSGLPVFAHFNQTNGSVFTWRPRASSGEKESIRMIPNAPPPHYTSS